MSLKIYYLTGFVGVICAVVTYFIDSTIAMGILMSVLFSLLNLILLSVSMKLAIKSDGNQYGFLMISNILRYSLLILCMYIAYKFPQYFSLIGVAIGMSLFLVALVIDAIGKRKG